MSSGPVHVFFATVSGNAEQLAEAAAGRLREGGRAVFVANLAEFPPAELETVETGLFVVSTWGDGEPPPEAAEFLDALGDESGPRLEKLRYAVLALGSSTYPDFCGCGRRLDEDLAGRGATRLLPRVDCDVKLKKDFAAWLEAVAKVLEAAA